MIKLDEGQTIALPPAPSRAIALPGHQTSRDERFGDIPHPRRNGPSVPAGRQQQSRGRHASALLQLSESGSRCPCF